MRGMPIIASAALVAACAANAANVSGDPDLPFRFFNTIPDVCFQTARGHPPTNKNASALHLVPTSNVPATVRAHYNRVTAWFYLKSDPERIFVGIGDRPNACHVVLANTRQTDEIQRNVIGFLEAGGFRLLQTSAPGSAYTDVLFAKEAPDGYMLISIQAPHSAVRDGEGDQGAVHVNLMPKAMFESMLSKH